MQAMEFGNITKGKRAARHFYRMRLAKQTQKVNE